MSLEPNVIEPAVIEEETKEAAAEEIIAENTPAEESEQPEKAGKKRKKEKKKKTVGQEILSWVWTLLAALAIATLVRAFIAEPVRVDGTSMTNTLQDGEIVLVSKMAYGKGSEGMKRGDIVICRYPGRTNGSFHLGAGLSLDSYEIFVKRMVALPGDTVEIRGGNLYVNNELVPNPEKMGSIPADFGPIQLMTDNPYTKKVDESQYFMIGDNRRTSHDSRASDVGPITRDMIMGKAVCVLFPFNAIRGIE
ncbi:MAG: signal peptidase I [Clostridia bacterium]|nr:signal peptidase I [Clostridia bacterium]MBR2053983.1 signal peptidase I [Clostridia bacterium]